jgi:hypothetical protein
MKTALAALILLGTTICADAADVVSVVCRGRMYHAEMNRYTSWDDETVLTFDFNQRAVFHKTEATPYRIVKITDATIHWLQSFPSGATWEGELSRVALRGREYVKGGLFDGNHNVYEQCQITTPRF